MTHCPCSNMFSLLVPDLSQADSGRNVRVLRKVLLSGNESWNTVERHCEDLGKGDESIPETLIVLLRSVVDCDGDKSFSDKKQKGDYNEDEDSVFLSKWLSFLAMVIVRFYRAVN